MQLRLYFVLGTAAVIFAHSVCAMEFCDYANTNELAGDRNLSARIRSFLGDKQVSFFYKGKLSTQVLDGLGGPPDIIRPVGGNLTMASACRFHSCDEKVAVIFACPSTIKAVGILHYDIRPGHFDPKAATLTIYAEELPSAVDMAFDAWQARIEETAAIRIVREVQTSWK
ncbi:hypothetical protein [uncultured Herbaspirillum sp.]|uniref:hypothetical protein n=1 Tax=uncultured Herbaspirillum sp. TaxID=160236 RepID=UPI0025868D0F|nr:hypothetical protein [uncultured Herbaspirillum sp.]